jgi:hypothetical protein
MVDVTAQPLTQQPTTLAAFVQPMLYAIVIPIVLLLILALLRAISNRRELTIASSSGLSVDLIFISIGAAGNAFRTPNLPSIWGVDAVTALLVVIVLDLLFAIFVIYAQQFWERPTILRSVMTLGLSGATVVFTGIVSARGH